MRKPKKYLVIFFVMALLGTNLEMATRWLGHDLEGFKGLRFASAAGWSSLWMLLVYGLAGVALGAINETRLGKWPMALQCLVGLAGALALELVVGYLLNVELKLAVWDYSDEVVRWGDRTVPLHLMGQISLKGAFRFFLTAPFAFWIDDLIRFIAYEEPRPPALWIYYRCILERGTQRRRRVVVVASAPTAS
jgi:hypothetical protein